MIDAPAIVTKVVERREFDISNIIHSVLAVQTQLIGVAETSRESLVDPAKVLQAGPPFVKLLVCNENTNATFWRHANSVLIVFPTIAKPKKSDAVHLHHKIMKELEHLQRANCMPDTFHKGG